MPRLADFARMLRRTNGRNARPGHSPRTKENGNLGPIAEHTGPFRESRDKDDFEPN